MHNTKETRKFHAGSFSVTGNEVKINQTFDVRNLWREKRLKL